MLAHHDIDEIDRKILKILQRDGGISNADLAEQIALSPSPCARRVKLLEESGLIRGKVTLLDPKAVGLPVNVFTQITLSRQRKNNLDRFEKSISEMPEIMECYLITGDFDYLIRAVVPDLDGCHRFLDKLTGLDEISQVKSSLSLKQIQYKTELPLEQLE